MGVVSVNVLAALISAFVALLVASISAFITIRGWDAAQRNAIKMRALDARLAHLSCQIDDLYGPLLGMCQQLAAVEEVYDEVRDKMSARHAQDNDATSTTWIFFRQHYIYPIRQQQVELLYKNLHLMETDELPASFIGLTHRDAMGRSLLHLWQSHSISSMKLGIRGRPFSDEEFHADVKTSLSALRTKYHKLLSELENNA